MAWCENNGVDFLFGLAKNARLNAEIETELAAAQEQSQRTGKPARRFKDFTWRTLKSWSCERRVVAGGIDAAGRRPMRVSSSLRSAPSARAPPPLRSSTAHSQIETASRMLTRSLCRRHNSAHTMRANQSSYPFASMAYVLVFALRRMASAPPVGPRLVRFHPPQALEDQGAGARQHGGVELAMPTAFSYQAEYHAAHAALAAAATA